MKAATVITTLVLLAAPAGLWGDGRIGVYIWGALRDSPDPLVTALDDARSLGAQCLRVVIAPNWDPRGIEDTRPLDQKMQRDDYQAAWRAAPAVIVTAYDAASYGARYRKLIQSREARSRIRAAAGPALAASPARLLSTWRYANPVTLEMTRPEYDAMLREVEDEFRRFSYELSKIEGTRFIVSNWEAENDAGDDVWPQYLEYTQARIRGIARGRARAVQEGYPGQVFSAFEFCDVDAGYPSVWSGQPRRYPGLSALPFLTGLDYVSLSSWRFINTEDPPSAFAYAFSKIHQGCDVPDAPCRILVGEAGTLRDLDPGSLVLGKVLAASLDQGAEFVCNWVLYDQPGEGVTVGGRFYDQSRWGKFTISGEITEQGLFVQALMSGPPGAPSETPAPRASATRR